MDSCGTMITSEEYLDVIVNAEYFDVNLLQKGCYIFLNDQIINVYFPRETLPPLSLDDYAYEVLPKCYTMTEEIENVNESIVAELSNRQGLTGEGILIGFIDSGIDYRNNSFRNSDGTTRIKYLWDQTIDGSAPVGYFYGTEYRSQMINQALMSEDPYQIVPSVDDNGHGTYIASVAAGSENISGDFKGIAPQCDIAVVKLKQAKKYLRDFYLIREAPESELAVYQENDIMLGLKYLSEIARMENKVLVVCMAIGSSLGQFGAASFLSSYINFLTRGKNFIVVATGNEANKRHHFSGKVNAESPTDIEVRTKGNNTGFWMEIWGDAPDIFSIGITSPGGDRIEKIVYKFGEVSEYNFVFEKTRVLVYYLLYGEREFSPLIVIRMLTPSDGVWKIHLNGERIIYGNVNAFLPLETFIQGETYFLGSDPDSTLVNPSSALGAITTGAYDTRNNAIYYASGRGYPEQGYVKPDIAAFGVRVLGQSNKNDGTLQAYSGTGVASAVTAGAIALFLQWAFVENNAPSIGNVIVKNFLQQAATRSDNREYPNREWGAYGNRVSAKAT